MFNNSHKIPTFKKKSFLFDKQIEIIHHFLKDIITIFFNARLTFLSFFSVFDFIFILFWGHKV